MPRKRIPFRSYPGVVSTYHPDTDPDGEFGRPGPKPEPVKVVSVSDFEIMERHVGTTFKEEQEYARKEEAKEKISEFFGDMELDGMLKLLNEILFKNTAEELRVVDKEDEKEEAEKQKALEAALAQAEADRDFANAILEVTENWQQTIRKMREEAAGAAAGGIQ